MPTKRLKIGEVYRDKDGFHQWRLLATNGNIVASGAGQPFNSLAMACKGLTHALDLNATDYKRTRVLDADGHVFVRYEIRRLY